MAEAKEFKSLKVTPKQQNFEGDSIHIEAVLNRRVLVSKYRIVPSNFGLDKGNGKCLHLQLTVDGIKRVLFTGSGYLMHTVEQLKEEDFPVWTTIIKTDKRLSFT